MNTLRSRRYSAHSSSVNPATQRRAKERREPFGNYMYGYLKEMSGFHNRLKKFVNSEEERREYWLWANAYLPQLSGDLYGETKSLRDTLGQFVSIMELAQELTPEYQASRKANEDR